MRGVNPNYHHAYNYNLLFVGYVVSVLLFRPALSIYANTLSSSESLTISGNRTIVSFGDDFELGFFVLVASLSNSNSWYLGIWYKNITERTYVWVANRDNPLSGSSGTLKISGINLVLLDQSNVPVWSTNITGAVRSPVVAELLPTGNFVLRDSRTNEDDGLLWQSFDYPTNTLLPDMKLGLDLKTGHKRILTSWKNNFDPSRGNFRCELRSGDLPELIVWSENWPMFRSGPWDGTQFGGMPDLQTWLSLNVVYNLTENKEEITFSYRVTTTDSYWRLVLNSDMYLVLSTWNPTTLEWYDPWVSFQSKCDGYSVCSANSYCDPNTPPFCFCMQGFEQKNPEYGKFSECVRKTNLTCSNGDGFFRMNNTKLPDIAGVIVDKRIGLKECEERCLRNCNCTAFANTDIRDGGSGCVMWTQEVDDVRIFPNEGQDLYVKLAAADLDKANNNGTVSDKPKNNNARVRTIIGLSVGAIVLTFLSVAIYVFWKRRKRIRPPIAPPNLGQDYDMPFLELEVIAKATNRFSKRNKLGEGGFGSVYKGKFRDGEVIAVKRLSQTSAQGVDEFTSEMKSIAKLQHVNLVRLVGCFADDKEKMLVYEYLEKGSLDKYIFGKSKGRKLDWKKRYDIINGIARGLLYLHQDSRCRVIHRDLKPSNILLDKNMVPKISDFGMAKIFAADETEGVTKRIVGTFGYMSPEYAMDGLFSIKSDIYSFGVLLLEIVTGRRNRDMCTSDLNKNLIGYVWRHWHERKALSVVDPAISKSILSSFKAEQALRCIQIGLLCTQDHYKSRPTTALVVVMLGIARIEIPEPPTPQYLLRRSSSVSGASSSSSSNDWTTNDFTKSLIKAR